MDRYQLVKLVQWAEASSPQGLKSRKRMQKVAFLLQRAKCPIDAEYVLHIYGPYSPEIAQVTDQLVQAGLLVEEAAQNQMGKQFNYRLNSEIANPIDAFEATAVGREARGRLADFEELAKQLLNSDLIELEHAATLAYFQQRGHSWRSALQKMCEFKRLPPDSEAAQSALKLAMQVVT